MAAKNLIQEKRAQSVRSRKYYDDYQVRMRSKMLKRRTREEMVILFVFGILESEFFLGELL